MGRRCTDTFKAESITRMAWVQGLFYRGSTAPMMSLIGAACSSWTPPPAPSAASLNPHAAIQIPHLNNFTPFRCNKFLQYKKLKRRERRAPPAGGFMGGELKRDAGWVMPGAGCGARQARDRARYPRRASKVHQTDANPMFIDATTACGNA